MDAYILMGVSGSGKSTYVNELKNKYEDVQVFSTDETLFANTGAYAVVVGYNHVEATKQLMMEYVKANNKQLQKNQKFNRVADSKAVVLDGTNLNRNKRRVVYELLKRYGVYTIVVPIFADRDTIMVRQEARAEEHTVPYYNVKQQFEALVVPRLGVDCDEVQCSGQKWFTKMDIKDINVVKDVVEHTVNEGMQKELLKNYAPHHCKPWHYETIDEHIALTIQNAKATLNEELVKIAIFHDLGKGVSKRFEGEQWEKYKEYLNGKEFDEDYFNLKARYDPHPKFGAWYFLNYMYSVNDFSESNYRILEAIYQHMNSHQGIGKKNKNKNNMEDSLLKLLEDFTKIDDMSRIKK